MKILKLLLVKVTALYRGATFCETGFIWFFEMKKVYNFMVIYDHWGIPQFFTLFVINIICCLAG
jgi:hypothetical protein